MEIPLVYTANSVKEAGRQNRKWYFWPVKIVGSVRVLIYVCVGVFTAGSMMLKGYQVGNMHDVGVGAAILAGIAAVVFLLYVVRQGKVKKAVAAQSTGRVKFDTAGLTITDATGAAVFEPWSLYSGFRTGKHIVLLEKAGKAAGRAIPTDTLSADETGRLRSALLGSLPERV